MGKLSSMHGGNRVMDISLILHVFLCCYWCYFISQYVPQCFQHFYTLFLTLQLVITSECGETTSGCLINRILFEEMSLWMINEPLVYP